jgi:HK97 family phage major capsid protein
MTYPEKGLRKGAKFLCDSSFPYTQLAGILDEQDRPIWVPSVADGVPDRLMGKPLLISDEVNDGELYYGQFKKIFGNLSSDINVESSTQSGFRNGSIDYRGFAIFDCKVAAPRAFGKYKKN